MDLTERQDQRVVNVDDHYHYAICDRCGWIGPWRHAEYSSASDAAMHVRMCPHPAL